MWGVYERRYKQGMKKYTADEIKEILEKHKRWLEESEGWSENDRADLSRANLSRADLYGANLSDGTKIKLHITCPDTGSFIAWKKAGGYIVKLEIPEDAKRSSATTRKCRADRAKVIEIQNIDGSKAEVEEVTSERGGVYKVGEMIYPDEWDDCRWNECSHGIHFFVTRMEAEDW